MIKSGPHRPKILQLATRIEDDIRSRNLQPGDGYLGTSEVARMLGVDTVKANRAMQLLTKRHLLSRRQGSGATIAEGIMDPRRPSLQRVHFVVHRNYLKTEGVLADGVMIGMEAELPGIDVQMNFLAPDANEDVASRLIATVLRSPYPEGVILVRASLAVQRLLQASGLPTVVLGSIYPSIRGLPWLDRDQQQGGQLLTQYLLDCNCQRILCLFRDRLFPGDYKFQDGIYETIAKAGRSVDFMVRNLPADQTTIQSAVSELVKDDNRGFGIIARTERLAEGAAAAVRTVGLEVGSDLPIVVSEVYRSKNQLAFPHLRNTMEPQQIGAQMGRMLIQQANGQLVKPDHIVLPVQLQVSDILSLGASSIQQQTRPLISCG